MISCHAVSDAPWSIPTRLVVEGLRYKVLGYEVSGIRL